MCPHHVLSISCYWNIFQNFKIYPRKTLGILFSWNAKTRVFPGSSIYNQATAVICHHWYFQVFNLFSFLTVMMPAYQVNRLYSLYFITFLAIGESQKWHGCILKVPNSVHAPHTQQWSGHENVKSCDQFLGLEQDYKTAILILTIWCVNLCLLQCCKLKDTSRHFQSVCTWKLNRS